MAVASPTDALPPRGGRQVIADHELLRPVASGSYGEVWLARSAVGTLRAVKIVRRDRFERAEDFEREFKGLQRFEPVSRSHEGLVDILQIGRPNDADWFYYVMELADDASTNGSSRRGNETLTGLSGTGDGREEGRRMESPHVVTYTPLTLRAHLRSRGALPAAEVISLGLGLTAALAYLHEQGLVHRDIKPSNILFVGGVPKLADAGLVAAMDDARSMVGTTGYIAPEGPGSPQADLYALGKVLYEAAFGKDRQDFPQLPSDLATRPDHARLLELNAVIARACAKDPKERYASAECLKEDLERLANGGSVRAAHRRARLWLLAQRVALALILFGIVVGGLTFLTRRVPPEVAEGGPPSTNELANALCDKALMNLRADNHRGYPEVYTNLHRAIGLDPNFARPYVGLIELVARESLPGVTYLPEDGQRTLTQRLIELAPRSGAAECGKAALAFYDWDFPAAERHVRRAIEISPGSEFIHTTYGYMLLCWGRTVEARQQLEIARTLRGAKVQVHRMLANSYYVDRNFSRAIELYRQAIEWDPLDLPSHKFLGCAQLAMDEYEQAIATWKTMESLQPDRTQRADNRLDRLLTAFRQNGRRGFWEEQWNQTPTNWFYERAIIRARLDDVPGAFALLTQSYQTHERDGPVQDELTGLLFNEAWDPLRGDVRFQNVLEKVGFTKVNPKLRK